MRGATPCQYTNPDTHASCGGAGTVLWAEETMRRKGKPTYLCLRHARELYPKLFPPPPEQMNLILPGQKEREDGSHERSHSHQDS
jgi:hypothetical protein